MGLLIAVTAGFWCLLAGFAAPAAAACEMSDKAGAGADCGTDFSPEFALSSSRSIASSEKPSFPWSSAAASGVLTSEFPRFLANPQPFPAAGLVRQTPSSQPLYRIAPKQSPPLPGAA